jgi:hypothetical protein
MKMEKWIILIILCTSISACDRPELASSSYPQISSSGSINTWIDAPLPNANIPLLPYNLVFHGASLPGIDEFEVQINSVVIATVLPTSSNSGGIGQGTLFLGEYLWTPPAPGTYLIMVRAGVQGQFSSSDQVLVTVSGEEIEVTSPLPSTPTPTPTSTPSPTHTTTLEEPLECTFTALVNLFCRLGPGIDYKEVDSFVPGQSANIVGQSHDGFFWYVLGPNSGKVCTVPKDAQFGETSGDCDDKPRFTPIPPTITPTPTPTEEPTGCTVLQPDGSIMCVVPCPTGAEPGEACTP